jgi:hypothetical protein
MVGVGCSIISAVGVGSSVAETAVETSIVGSLTPGPVSGVSGLQAARNAAKSRKSIIIRKGVFISGSPESLVNFGLGQEADRCSVDGARGFNFNKFGKVAWTY